MKLLSPSFFSLVFYMSSLACTPAESFPIWRTIIVDRQGSGDFPSVQSAVNSVQVGNNRWVRIHVKSGEYREKVIIPWGKDYILLEGEGRGTTVIVSSGNMYMPWENGSEPPSAALDETATFTSHAENIVVKNICFKNDYNEVNQPIKRALAALVNGDKTSFYDCGFVGLQDTLCDMRGRHYFKNCYIEGAVDFIFGLGQTIYEDCIIYANCSRLTGPGWITAQGRIYANDSNGFVFKYCSVGGDGQAFLGRAWGPNSRVLFFMTFLSDIVVSQGWDSWTYAKEEGGLIFAEASCRGPGSNTTQRVNWMKSLNEKELQILSTLRYIDDEGWLQRQP